LIPGLVGDESTLRRSVDEARATLRLRHERIVGTQDLVQERENNCINMEYVPAGSLEDRLKSEDPLPQPEALRVVGNECQGLGHAHEPSIVHCDPRGSSQLGRLRLRRAGPPIVRSRNPPLPSTTPRKLAAQFKPMYNHVL
jgi:serine/threonine protein kinase